MTVSIDKNVQFHDQLNPEVWSHDRLDPRIRYHLLKIAKLFIDNLGVKDLPLLDIILTGSLASYNYTPYSDFDLHILIDDEKIDLDRETLQALLKPAKALWSKTYPITIKDYDVELYVQTKTEPSHSNGVFSLLDNRWIENPKKEHPLVNDGAIRVKALHYMEQVDRAIEEQDLEAANNVKKKIVKMRRIGMEKTGQYSVENLTFKVLRNQGYISRISDFINRETTKELSIKEQC